MDPLSGAKGLPVDCTRPGQVQYSGWSPTGGQALSAFREGSYENGRAPSGSSSGGAIASSAGLAAAVVNGDTFGSNVGSLVYMRYMALLHNFTYDTLQIHPASAAGRYGVRISSGLISNQGVVPYA